jgi:integrase
MKLTERLIRETKAPESGRTVLTDGRGLQLRITAKDVRSWSLQYSFNGRKMKETLGQWPSISVMNARKLADAARLQVASGIDPQEAKRAAKTARLTFADAWHKFDLLHISDLKSKTALEYRRSASADILPALQKIALNDIKKADIVALIDRIRRRAPVLANRTLALLRKFFNWCLGRDYIELNPALGIPRATKELSRDRILSLSEMQSIYNAADLLSNGNQLLVKLMLLTGQREGVIAQLEQSELRGDHIVIERNRNKSGERIRVSLSPIAQKLIADLGSKDGRYVVSNTDGAKPISGFSKLKTRLDQLTNLTQPWRMHDMRRGISTYLEENGLDRAYTARILSHRDPSVTGIYARPEHRQHLENVLVRWSEILSGVNGKDANNVLLFAR